MQASVRVTSYFGNHLTVALIAAAIICIAVAGTAALTLTNDGGRAITGSRPVFIQADTDPLWTHRPTDRPASMGSMSAQSLQSQSFYAHKEARQDAEELHRSKLAEAAAQQDTLRRYGERKEQQFTSYP
jgi:hypothetical protein